MRPRRRWHEPCNLLCPVSQISRRGQGRKLAPRAGQELEAEMDRPTVVREIYAELRRVADPDCSASELLRAAAEIAEALRQSTGESGTGLTYYTGGVPFDRWSVDRAMADGGWRILRYETELAPPNFDDESPGERVAIKGWMTEMSA